MKNAGSIETIDKTKHSKLRVKPNPDYVHVKDANLISITLGEISGCTSNYPVVFVRMPNNTLHPVALLGLRPGENVYYGKENWDSTYIPRLIQCHPFVIGFDDRSEDSVMLAPCLDTSSAFLSEEEGVALFTEAGVATDFQNIVSQMLKEVYDSEKVTNEFSQKLEALGLLSPFVLLLQPANGEARKITGMYVINDAKMRALTPEQVLELHKLDFLPPCYMIQNSLFQLSQLLRLRNRKTEEQIVDYRAELELEQPAAAQ